MRTWDMWEVYLQALKISLFLKKFTNFKGKQLENS